MKNIRKALQRPLYALSALGLLAGVVLTALVPGMASAYGEVTNRSIELSSSKVSATGVTYKISFTETAATVAKSVVVDFCDSSPLYADTCAHTNGLSVASAALGSQTGTSGWTLATTPASQRLTLSGATANSAAAMSFEITGMGNPTANGSFYARIYTYAAQTNNYSNETTPGTVLDFGGIAMSTADSVQITAKVQEKLQFCVSATAMTGNTCTGQTTPAITIGNGTPKVLDTTTSTAPAYIQVSTNAGNGVSIRMKNSNSSCVAGATGGGNGGLSRDGGTTCDIGPANGGLATSAALSGAQFGLYCTPDVGLTATAPYADSVTPTYGMDTSSTENVTTTYGSQILSSTAPLDGVNSTLTFGAQSALTTPAGIYSASMDLIATGTF